jgi:hypothetical protein
VKFRLMVDSGAHTYFEKMVRKGTGIYDRHLWDWEAYKKPVFHNYLADYAHFLKENKDVIDVAVNLDAIYDPKVSYGNYCYLKYSLGIDVLPVYHFAEDIKWFKKYMKHTDYIGISGLGQGIPKKDYHEWVNKVFDLICDNPDRLPTWKIHGFAMTSVSLISMYPFYSCDSSSWVQFARFGKVLIPLKRNNEYNYTLKPLEINVSSRRAKTYKEGDHFDSLPSPKKQYILAYLDSIDIPYGKSLIRKEKLGYIPEEDEKIYRKKTYTKVETFLEKGISNRHEYRDMVNFLFYAQLTKSVPPWPWPWYKKRNPSRLI